MNKNHDHKDSPSDLVETDASSIFKNAEQRLLYFFPLNLV